MQMTLVVIGALRVNVLVEWSYCSLYVTATDLRQGKGSIYRGKPEGGKADCSLTVADDDLVGLATGKLNAQTVSIVRIYCVVYEAWTTHMDHVSVLHRRGHLWHPSWDTFGLRLITFEGMHQFHSNFTEQASLNTGQVQHWRSSAKIWLSYGPFYTHTLKKWRWYWIWVVGHSGRQSVGHSIRHYSISAQYLEKKLTEFHQILFMHSYWQDQAWDCYTSFFAHFY